MLAKDKFCDNFAVFVDHFCALILQFLWSGWDIVKLHIVKYRVIIGSSTNGLSDQLQTITEVITGMEKSFLVNFCGAVIILYMHPANERRRYNVMSSLIGWVHIQNEPCGCTRCCQIGNFRCSQWWTVILMMTFPFQWMKADHQQNCVWSALSVRFYDTHFHVFVDIEFKPSLLHKGHLQFVMLLLTNNDTPIH